jgi:hypothetical protein
VPSFFDLHVTENGNPMAVLIISGFLPSIRFIDLKTKEDAKPAIDLKKLISVGSIISSVSKIVNNKIVLSESGGKFCVIDRLNEVSLFGTNKNLYAHKFDTLGNSVMQSFGG